MRGSPKSSTATTHRPVFRKGTAPFFRNCGFLSSSRAGPNRHPLDPASRSQIETVRCASRFPMSAQGSQGLQRLADGAASSTLRFPTAKFCRPGSTNPMNGECSRRRTSPASCLAAEASKRKGAAFAWKTREPRAPPLLFLGVETKVDGFYCSQTTTFRANFK